jgi:hypothetical protein
MGAFWGSQFQVFVASMQWAMAKGHTIGRMVVHQMDTMETEVARIGLEDLEAQRAGAAISPQETQSTT